MQPILTLSQRLSSALAVLCGRYGDVTRHAHHSGYSRQAVYRQADRVCDDLEGGTAQARIAQLEQEVAQLRSQLRELTSRLERAVEISEDRLAQFAATAQAEGVSLPVARRLVVVFRGADTPSVATLGRLTADAAHRAAALLPVLDEVARPLVRQAAGDEIFFGRRPTLMVLEPLSGCWLTGRLVPHRDGETWGEELRRYPALDYLVSDAGTALAKGVRLARQQRPALVHGLDLFHTAREGGEALRGMYQRAARATEAASVAQRQLDRLKQQGLSRRISGGGVGARWRKASRLLDQAAAAEDAWRACRAALDWFTPEGRLNDRRQAEARQARALPRLCGPAWAKVRRLLEQPETLGFLDQMHRGLAELGLAEATLAAVVRLEGLRRRPELLRGEGPAAAALRGVALVRAVQLAKGESEGAALVERVRVVVRRAGRASSCVEGLNSVARMQQARHRKVTQGLLDLKRLYWNVRRFRTGRRKGKTPYGLLGVQLPTSDWWELLKQTPEQLRQQLSAPRVAA